MSIKNLKVWKRISVNKWCVQFSCVSNYQATSKSSITLKQILPVFSRIGKIFYFLGSYINDNFRQVHTEILVFVDRICYKQVRNMILVKTTGNKFVTMTNHRGRYFNG